MLLYLTLWPADLLIWYIVVRSLRGRSRVVRTVIITVKALITILMALLFFAVVLRRADLTEQAGAFRQTQFGTIIFLQLLLLFTLIAVALAGKVAALFTGRRPVWGAPLILSLFLLISLLVADGYLRQRLNIVTVRREVTIAGLDPSLDGLKLALLSDLHLSSWYGSYERLERAMAAISDEKPDLLLNTGDFISYGWQEFGRCDTLLGKADASLGAFAVEGNHDDGTYNPHYDHEYGVRCREEMGAAIAASGYTLLRDSAVIIPYGSSAVAVAGVTTHGHRLMMSYGDFSRALSPVPDTLFTILLLHDPDGWPPPAGAHPSPHLTLSGHTHGFQAGIPGAVWSPSALIHKRWRGLYEDEGRQLFVTTGLGCMGMALRVFMPPEIVILTIRAG